MVSKFVNCITYIMPLGTKEQIILHLILVIRNKIVKRISDKSMKQMALALESLNIYNHLVRTLFHLFYVISKSKESIKQACLFFLTCKFHKPLNSFDWKKQAICCHSDQRKLEERWSTSTWNLLLSFVVFVKFMVTLS